MVLEAHIEQRTCDRALRELKVRNLKLNGKGQTGWPDRMFLIPGGRPLFIEFKRPGEVLRPRQVHIIKILRHNGYEVQVHDNTDRAFQEIARAVEAARVPKEGC